MDQESFRKLLQGSSSGAASHTTSRAGKGVGKPKKTSAKPSDPAQPAFKPRTVKKNDDKYRDRAAERRQGLAHDYAQVEALAEDFERRNKELDKETIEQQRRYLGGDSEHTVLVKGLDFALLEQNKARQVEATEDDDTLEQAFIEGTSNVPNKRTREDIVNELKNKRLKSDNTVPSTIAASANALADEAKKAGKFKPIGFKPVGSADGKKAKKLKEGEKAGVKKKKKKSARVIANPNQNTETRPVDTSPISKPTPEPEIESTNQDEDDDIFAGAAEYTGIELGDDEDEDNDNTTQQIRPDDISDTGVAQPAHGRWFATDEDALPRRKSSPPKSPIPKSTSPPSGRAHIPESREKREPQDQDMVEEAPMRLQPLVSSSVPSIRDLLAIDEEVEKAEKRKAKKEKRKEKIGLSAEGKVERDYQRLKAYTEKKGGK